MNHPTPHPSDFGLRFCESTIHLMLLLLGGEAKERGGQLFLRPSVLAGSETGRV